jgi:hypothetical protein
MPTLRNFDDLVIEQLQDRELAAEYLNAALELVPKLTHKFKIDLFGCKITPK